MGRESYLPLFFGDFLASTYTWDGEEQALYLLLLGYQWTAGPLPDDPARLARAVRYDPKRFTKLWATVSAKFAARDDGAGLVNVRLEEHRANSIEIGERKSRAGKAGAEARWNGTGNAPANAPAIAHGMRPHPNRNDSANGIHPSYPSIPKNSLPSGERGGADAPAASTAKPKLRPFDVSTVPGLDLAAWEEFEAYRAARKPAIKPESRGAAAKALAAYGPDQMAVVQQSIAAGYQGLVPLKSKENHRGTPPQSPRKSAVERVRDASGCDLRTIIGKTPPGVGGSG